MDFGRSSQYRPPGQTARAGQKQFRREPEDPMHLPKEEIVSCINGLLVHQGFSVLVSDFTAPQPQKTQRLFECVAEVILNTTVETVEPAMSAAAYEICGGEVLMELVPTETRNQMGLFILLRNLLADVGVTDFRLADLIKPEPKRLIHIFSYLINFARFREQHLESIDKHQETLESTKRRTQDLQVSNQNLEVRLAELKSQRRSTDEEYKNATGRYEELRTKLQRLKIEQDERAAQQEGLKAQRTTLAKALQDKVTRKEALLEEKRKLQPYAMSSARDLQDQLEEIREALRRDKQALAAAEKRLRGLNTSSDAFGSVAASVDTVVTLLKSLEADLKSEEQEVTGANKRKDALQERILDVRKVEREQDNLKKQLERWEERIHELRKTADLTGRAASQRMQELATQRKQILADQGDKGREVERRKIRVEQAEKRMADLKETIEAEVHATRQEYLKMDKHIRLYIAEMGKCIDSQR